MRIAGLMAASLLVAGCSHAVDGHAGQTPSTPGSAAPSTAAPSGAPPPSKAPAAGAAMSDVVAWIGAAHPADPARYHSVVREGVTTPIGDDVAFTVKAAQASCTTDAKHTGAALVCLVSLTSPPPRPETAYGDWKGGWVQFDGTGLQVGAARGDPGPFVNGDGPELANGDSLSFGDYRCRADQAGLFCVNYAHQSAVRLAPDGVQPFGCLRSAPPPDGIGIAFSC
ncbi:hypothetical protein [Mycobacterium sp. Marseille-P9652]|uniref:hypothetical protein n=1 Tax=Mycobacterium sp. Marseille-P9652 TaxID=2654950 RepID=UPI0012E8341A|nr:hypothetical protein [Mycobacterium sp. Marseille-P9652]